MQCNYTITEIKSLDYLKTKILNPSVYAHNAKFELNEYDRAEKSEQKAEESIGERVKLRRQKADDKTDETVDEQLDTTYMPEFESEESAE